MVTKDEQLKKEIEKLENKSYLDLTLILSKLNLNKKDIDLINNSVTLDCLDNRLLGRQEKEKELLNEFLEYLEGIKSNADYNDYYHQSNLIGNKIKEIQERLSKLQ